MLLRLFRQALADTGLFFQHTGAAYGKLTPKCKPSATGVQILWRLRDSPFDAFFRLQFCTKRVRMRVN